MTSPSFRRSVCRFCGGPNLELVLPLTPTALADAYVPASRVHETQDVFPLDLYLCRDCGGAQLLDVVIPQVIYVDYIYETKSSLGLVDHFKRYAADVVARIAPAPGGLVVDLGSNDGSLLGFFKQHGMRVLGVDPAQAIAADATARGIETLPVFFDAAESARIRQEYGPAAIVTANNVFANVDDMDAFAGAIRGLLAPDGVFVFESFYLVDWMQHMVFDFTYHEHLSYFSVKPMQAFFRRHGMQLINAQRVPTKGGSVRYTAKLAGAARAVDPSVGELIALEQKLGVHQAAAFKTFAATIEKKKQDLLNVLRPLQAGGLTIAGYGASATTTTLVYHYQLGDMLRFIADDYTAKQHLFSPGHHIPVLPPEALYTEKPDCVVILAWRYWEPIVRQHQRYLDLGGRFIVPLPDVQVI